MAKPKPKPKFKMFHLSALGIAAAAAASVTLSSAAVYAEQSPPLPDDWTTLMAIRGALQQPSQLVTDYQEGGWRGFSLHILDSMVQEGLRDLHSAGQADLSNQLQKEWQTVLNDQLNATDLGGGEFRARDLGDHPPLSLWLANFINILNSKTHGVAGKVQLINDLETLNYAIPVVFNPAGSWQASCTQKTWVEYRLHFIPFADILTYWGSLEGCKYAVAQLGVSSAGDLCDIISNKLEQEMGRYFAPKLSDSIFVAANPGTVIDDSGPTQPDPSQRPSLQMPSAEHVLQALKKGGE